MRFAAIAMASALVAGAAPRPLLAAPTADDGKPPAAEPDDRDDDELTSPTFREDRTPVRDAVWLALALPEYLVQLAFTPAALAVTMFERHRLDRRIYDALRNDAGTIVVTPDVKLAGGEGFGGGATLSLERIGGGELDIGALGRLNGDYELEVEYERALVSAEGRELVLTVVHELDQNLRFYGIGDDTNKDDRRVLSSTILDGIASFDLTPPGVLDLTGLVEGRFHYEQLTGGDDPTVPPVAFGDAVTPPSDFESELLYGQMTFTMQYDTRDTVGRPSRGVVAKASGTLIQEVTGSDFSVMGADASLTAFVPLLPYHRTLMLAGGVSGRLPFGASKQLPLFSLSTLGRKNHLRGFGRYRFRDRHAWWATAEYRFPIYEYIDTGGALDAVFFAEAGRVANRLRELVTSRMRIDGGVGLRGGYEAGNFFELALGYSVEGMQFGFALGRKL